MYIAKKSTKLKSIEDPKFQKVVPNTAKVIYAWDKKILSFSKNSKFCKQEIYKNDHIIDIHVNTEEPYTWQVFDLLLFSDYLVFQIKR